MTVSTVLILLACLLISAKLVGWLCQRVGVPPVLGEIMVGILIGPSALNWLQPGELINTIATLGVIFLMFIAGVETDTAQMRQVGGVAVVAATLGVIIPFLAGTIFVFALGFSLPTSLFLGTLLTATSVSISAQTMKDMGKLNSKEGATILGGAVIDDILGLVVLSLVLVFTLGKNPFWTIGQMLAYFPLALLVGHFGFPLLSRYLPRTLAAEARLALILALVLFYAWSAQALGDVAAITGAYIAGMFIGRTEMKEWVHEGVSKIGYAFFIPIFFVNIGIQANIHGLWQTSPLLLFGLIGIAILAKVAGCGGGALLCRFQPVEALRVGVGMISRGEVALITASIGLQGGLITPSFYSVAILITVVTTIVTPPLLKLTYLARSQRGSPCPTPSFMPVEEVVQLKER